jgi:hypothetical protein
MILDLANRGIHSKTPSWQFASMIKTQVQITDDLDRRLEPRSRL